MNRYKNVGSKVNGKILKWMGIERTRDEPKLFIEIIGDKTHLGGFRFFILWSTVFFFLVDAILPILTMGPSVFHSVSEHFLDYLFRYLDWTILWIYCIYLLFFFKRSYLKIIDKLYEDKRILTEDYNSLKKQLLIPNHVTLIRCASILFLVSMMYFHYLVGLTQLE